MDLVREDLLVDLRQVVQETLHSEFAEVGTWLKQAICEELRSAFEIVSSANTVKKRSGDSDSPEPTPDTSSTEASQKFPPTAEDPQDPQARNVDRGNCVSVVGNTEDAASASGAAASGVEVDIAGGGKRQVNFSQMEAMKRASFFVRQQAEKDVATQDQPDELLPNCIGAEPKGKRKRPDFVRASSYASGDQDDAESVANEQVMQASATAPVDFAHIVPATRGGAGRQSPGQREKYLRSWTAPTQFETRRCYQSGNSIDDSQNVCGSSTISGIRKTVKQATVTVMETEGWQRCQTPDWWREFVESSLFDYIATSFVIVNAVTIGMQADWSVRNNGATVPTAYDILEKIFCIVFFVELSMRFSVAGVFFFTKPGWRWNVFDTIVVSMQVVEEIINLATPQEEKDSEKSGTGIGGSNFNFVRVLRILRLLRVFRIVRIVRFVSELRTMVASIANSLRSLFWTVILIFLMIYVVGVYLTQLVADYIRDNRDSKSSDGITDLRVRYGSLGDSLLSLFQGMTGGVDWEELCNPLMLHISPLLGIIFTVYISFAVLAMMNVVTAVFIESALSNAKQDKDQDMQQYMRKFMSDSDEDDETHMSETMDATITWEDFKTKLRDPSKRRLFRALDLDVAEAKGLFQLLDTEDTGVIQIEEFVSCCLQLRGPAKAIDLATIMYQQKRISTKWAHHASFVEEALEVMLEGIPSKRAQQALVEVHLTRESQSSLDLDALFASWQERKVRASHHQTVPCVAQPPKKKTSKKSAGVMFHDVGAARGGPE